jgi:Sulfate permease family
MSIPSSSSVIPSAAAAAAAADDDDDEEEEDKEEEDSSNNYKQRQRRTVSVIMPSRRPSAATAAFPSSTSSRRRVSALYEAIHRHEYPHHEDGEDEDTDGPSLVTAATGGTLIIDDIPILDLQSKSMRRASRDLLSATHMRSRQLFVDLQYHPPSARMLNDDDHDDDGDDGDDEEDGGGGGGGGDDMSVTYSDTDYEATTTTSYSDQRYIRYTSSYGDESMSENRPLLPSLESATATAAPQVVSNTHASSKSTHSGGGALAMLSTIVQQVSAVAVVALLTMMISIPFGASYFPIGWRAEGIGVDGDTQATEVTPSEGNVSGSFPMPGKQALGIRMFLFATLMGQLAFTFSSKFENPVGLQMVENVPFLHALSYIVIQQQGYGREALSTVCFLFGLSSVMVGATFYLLGKWKLGRIVYFFPNHVLVGCIGGIGVFLIITAMEVTSDTTFTFDHNGILGLVEHWDLLSVVLSFETVLRILQHVTKDKHGNAKFPLLSPVYYCMITPFFYFGLYLFGVSTQQASDRGFFFPAIEGDSTVPTNAWHDPHLWDMFTLVDLATLSWTAIFQSFGTMVALAAFSLIHVPINIPAFAISTDVGK